MKKSQDVAYPLSKVHNRIIYRTTVSNVNIGNSKLCNLEEDDNGVTSLHYQGQKSIVHIQAEAMHLTSNTPFDPVFCLACLIRYKV